MTGPRIPFASVRALALARVRELCPRLVPRGVFKGNWYFAKVPWRDDGTASLGISLTSGRWQDWGRPGDDGTFIDLIARIDGCSIPEAKDRLAEVLGMTGDPQAWNAPPRPPRPRCDACQHGWQRWPWSRSCTAALGLDDEPWPTSRVRRRGWPCGPDGKLYAAKEVRA